jgi:hypothetical protein
VAYEVQREAAAERFFAGLLAWAGVERPVEVTGGDVEVRFTESGASRLMFVFNHGEAETFPTIAIRRPAKSAVDLATGGPLAIRDGKLQVRLARGGAWVVKLD